jgi:hypothetical protein
VSSTPTEPNGVNGRSFTRPHVVREKQVCV